MKRATCLRLFEVEALRDGRISGAERAQFERHLATCAACAREAEELAALGRALREEPPPRDELHRRRERTRLLAAFDRSLIAGERPWSRRQRWSVLVAAAALLAVSIFVWRAFPTREPLQEPNAVIRADAATLWSRRMQGGREQIALERGALWIRVAHGTSSAPLLVVLPDGELEDIGTTFSVAVEAGRTTRVSVEEGSVVLRIRGQAPVTIEQGGAWPAMTEPPASASAPVLEPAPSASQAARPPPSSRSPPRSGTRVEAERAASKDFRAGVAALERGDNGEAALRFERFIEQHPEDTRAEDAAYLRVLALQRAGDVATLRAAAQQYLSRFPAGFRRKDVERLAR
jgi:hypothetical protein